MEQLSNPWRGRAFDDPALVDIPPPSTDAKAVQTMLAKCPHAGVTTLIDATDLAHSLGLARVHIKDERGRMGLGSFKALGAAYVIACDAAQGTAQGATYVTASAGNHGLSVAAGASAFGAKAQIYLSHTVPEAFADRLRAIGAEVVWHGDDYEQSMQAAQDAAAASGAILLSDSSWAGYTERPHRLMEGYLALMDETFDQIDAPPTHLFLQAGVGGLAGAAAALARAHWGDDLRIVVVEPTAAPALIASVKAGHVVDTTGPVSAMGRLDCKTPSLIALKGLARDADDFVTLSEAEGDAGAALAQSSGYPSTPSGAAGLAALSIAAQDGTLGLNETSRALLILSEGPDA